MLNKQPQYVDDVTENIGLLFKLRFPWLALGLFGGLIATQLVSKFESVLSQNLSLAFFIPLIVYMSGAVGMQTETIIVRSLAIERINYKKLLIKEIFLGLLFGVAFAAIMGIFTYLWLNDIPTTLTVTLAIFVNLSIAPLVATLMTLALQKYHTDPAASAGPFATIVQDIISLLIYFLIASWILL